MRKAKGYKADTVFVLVSFGVFAVSMLTVLLFGATIYKNIVSKSQDGYDDRMCLSYIWTRVKNNDTAGGVYVEEFCGLPALCLEEEFDDTAYRTTIYLYDGWIRELFSETGLEFSPEDGIPVIEADALDFEQMEDGLIRAEVNSENLFIYPRGNSGMLVRE